MLSLKSIDWKGVEMSKNIQFPEAVLRQGIYCTITFSTAASSVQDLNVPLIVQPQAFGVLSLLSWTQASSVLLSHPWWHSDRASFVVFVLWSTTFVLDVCSNIRRGSCRLWGLRGRYGVRRQSESSFSRSTQMHGAYQGYSRHIMQGTLPLYSFLGSSVL